LLASLRGTGASFGAVSSQRAQPRRNDDEGFIQLNQVIRLTGRPGDRTQGKRRTLRLAVVIPVLDDWRSFATLVGHIIRQVGQDAEWLEIVAVDDGSAECFDLTTIALPDNAHVDAIRIVHLALNLGHQRAIAVGLVTLAPRKDLDHVIVMDSDGEDRPEDIPLLLEAGRLLPGQVILAHRAKRSESMMFKAGYETYKFFFRMLTGRGISFGNFSLLPIAAVRRLVHMSELWNNLPAAIIRSRLRFTPVCTVRGTRNFGRSRMNFPDLVIHGLSAMSVYTDLIFVRVLLATAAVSVLAFVAICVVLAVRFGTTLAIPGWATTVFGDLVIILFQAVLMIVATSLMVLAGRSARPIVPITDALVYVQSVSDVLSGQLARPYIMHPE
jgi:polyisoprenyl-phosphate glycosyltransferase